VVVAGAVIAIVMCSLSGLLMLLLMIAAGSIASEFGLGDVGAGLILIGLICAAVSAVGIVAAARTIAGSNAWRITLVVLSALTALISLIWAAGALADEDAGSFLLALFWGALAALVIALLFVGGANQWFNAMAERRFAAPAAYEQPSPGGMPGANPQYPTSNPYPPPAQTPQPPAQPPAPPTEPGGS